MSVAFKLEINDTATPALAELKARISGFEMRNVAGRAGVLTVQAHLRGLGPNKQFPQQTTNFWARAARATNYRHEGDSVIVAINQIGVRQRYKGGTISARNAKYLTIPATQEAYGKLASEFDNLKFVKFRSGAAALVEALATQVKIGAKRKDGTRKVTNLGETGGRVVYWLRKSVTQQPNEGVIPNKEQMLDAVGKALKVYLDMRRKR